MQAAVAQIISPSDAPVEKLQKLYARVQQLRNTSYEEHRTEQERKRDSSKVNNNVEDVWKHGYGSGIQLTWLYLGLVKAAGFNAYGLWVSDRQHYFFDPSQMDASRLDANVVLIQADGKDYYCDPGAAYARFGLLPWFETGVQGLRLDKNGSSWIRTPLPDSSVSQVVRKADLKLTEEGDLEGKLTVTYSGLEALSKRIDRRHDDDTERKKYLEDHVKQYIPVAAEVELQNHPDWSTSAPLLTAEFKIKIVGWASNAGKRVLLPVGIFSASERGSFDSTNRIHRIYFDYPYQKTDDVEIEIPAGWKVSSLPARQERGNNAVAFSLKTSEDSGGVRISRSLRIDALTIPLDQYPALRNFFQFMRTGDDAQIMLQPQTATASK